MNKKRRIILLIIVLVVIQFIWNINDSRQIKANRFIKDIQAKVIIGEAVILPCYYHKEDIKPTYIDFLFKKAKDLITIRIIERAIHIIAQIHAQRRANSQTFHRLDLDKDISHPTLYPVVWFRIIDHGHRIDYIRKV